jgi:hypothetical protein
VGYASSTTPRAANGTHRHIHVIPLESRKGGGYEQIISYVGWQEGVAKRIPVILQRIWPGWFTKIIYVLLIAGLCVAINLLLTLIRFLAEIYWK